MRSYSELVEAARKLSEESLSLMWAWGDLALEVAPSGYAGKARLGAHQETVDTLLLRWMHDAGCECALSVMKNYRDTSRNWPPERRVKAAHGAHRLLNGHPERFEILKPGMTCSQVRLFLGGTSAIRRIAAHKRGTVSEGIRYILSGASFLRTGGRILMYRDLSDEQRADLMDALGIVYEELAVLDDCATRVREEGAA